MHLQITRQTEYAIHTLLELASVPFGQMLQARSISERQEIPEVFLKKTIQLLALAGLVTTQRGAQGGVRLTVPGDQITIAQIITAIEGKVAINVCLAEGNQCMNKSSCQVHRILKRAQDALVAELSRETLADILAKKEVGICENGAH
jgi:Rrf2 family transcriptional regulator, nitric oxide-sensitive transcriptional repressor